VLIWVFARPCRLRCSAGYGSATCRGS